MDEKILALGAQTPRIHCAPPARYAMREQDYGMTIGVAVTRGGRLFACWVGGGDNPKAYFLLSYSDDAGMTWSEPCLAIDPHDPSLPYSRCTIVGTLWVDPLNRLWLFFNQTLEHFDGKSSNWYIRLDRPEEETLSWSQPRYLSYGCTLNKPIVCQNGDWLLPVSLWQRYHISEPFRDCYHELDGERMAHIFASRDQGQTWERRGGAFFPDSAFDEHMLVELRDGRLWMLGRTRTHGLYETHSRDGGATWDAPERAFVQSVSARFHLRRLQSGRLLLIKHGEMVEKAAENRSQLTAFLSEDDGAHWSRGFVLDERFGVSYPDSDQACDGTLYITYDRNRATDGEILLARLREEDILAGRLVTEGAFVKRVIRKPGKLC